MAQRTRVDPQAIEERFWSRVEKTDGCWLWAGRRSRDGYGELKAAGQEWRAHRLAWTLASGPILDGLLVLHRCDNPPCVRPDHLFLGTNADNVADRNAKGRSETCGPRGHLPWTSKLSQEQVLEIRALYATGAVTQRQLAKQFRVAQMTISDLIRRRSWHWLP